MLRDPGGDGRALAAGMAAERTALRELGDLAGEHGITIAVENRDPIGRHILRQAYGLDLARLAAQIEQVDHLSVGICFDTGHAFLASAWLGFDYLEGVRRIAPLTAHIHLSDNFGNVMLDETSDPAENLIQGLGDLHLLPGWGAVPFDAIAAIPLPRNPVSIVELRATFGEHLDEAARGAGVRDADRTGRRHRLSGPVGEGLNALNHIMGSQHGPVQCPPHRVADVRSARMCGRPIARTS